MAYTLKGRLETRLAVGLAPLLAACALALAFREWWPVELALLMLAVGVALYHRFLPYQAGWLALPLGLLELGAVMGLVRLLDVAAPLGAAVGLYAGTWLLGQVLVHAAFPLARLTYGDDGGELGRPGAAATAAVLTLVASSGGVAWGTQPPTVHLAAGVHQGPLVLDSEQSLVGAQGAVVRGGILVTADGVTIRDVTVVGGEHGIEVDGATGVVLDGVTVRGAAYDGINVRRSSVAIRDCIVETEGEYTQGIDVSFGFDLAPSLIEGCTVRGGQEGIVTHFAHVVVRENHVTGTTMRAITLTEMSMATVEENEIEGVLGVGIFCGDYSMCEIERNSVTGTRPDLASEDITRRGYGILSHYGATATIADNRLRNNGYATGSFLDARISSE
jgi:nitrous oxidase accessory protein NosD